MCKNGKKVKPQKQKVRKPNRIAVEIERDPDKVRFTSLFKRHNPSTGGNHA